MVMIFRYFENEDELESTTMCLTRNYILLFSNPDEVKDKFRQYYNLHLLCVKQLLLWIQTLPSTICQNIKPRQTVENQKENDECKRREKSYIENKIGTDYIHFLRPRPIKFNKPT